MKEDFLYYVWKYHLYSTSLLKTVQGDAIEIIKSGRRNNSSGPDFLEAQIKIETISWVGNVEIHVKSSDWNRHKHQYDKAYNNVVLHVVFEHDLIIRNERGEVIPTLVLKDKIQSHIWKNYQNFLQTHCDFIPCEKNIIHFENTLIKNHFKTRLLIERFEEKTQLIEKKLQQTQFNWEAVLFIFLTKYFGTKINREAMELVGSSFDFAVLKKCGHKKEQLEALLFGQAGFLENPIEDTYFNQLQSEYRFLQSKFELQPCKSSIFKFYGVRPPNYITIRLAQLASLYHEYHNLFSFLMKIKSVKNIYPLFDIKVDKYWETHYHFGKKTIRSSKRKLSESFIDLIVINAILPIQYCYQKQRGKHDIEIIEKILCEIKAENNTIIKNFGKLKLQSHNAWDSQALIQLKTKYCNQKKCLNCEIGNKLLQRKN
ncbi:MAG: DUF2851 family protein [Flavobacteriales bacterium]